MIVGCIFGYGAVYAFVVSFGLEAAFFTASGFALGPSLGAFLASPSSVILGLPKTAVGGAGGSFGGSLGAVLTFHSGLTLGAPLDLDAVTLMTSSVKKMSNEMLGIWKAIEVLGLKHTTLVKEW